jgi:coenzyme F420-reducing hydrogenase delta subunit
MNIKIIKVPCTGKVDIIHLMRSFEKGADGVYVVGCEEGSCQFTSGNLRARKRVEKAQQILESIGIGGERVQMYNLSSSEAPRFVQIAKEMTEKIKDMGPNPIKLARGKKAA